MTNTVTLAVGTGGLRFGSAKKPQTDSDKSRAKPPPPLIAGVFVTLLLAGCEQSSHIAQLPGDLKLVRVCYFSQAIARGGDQFYFVEPGRVTPIGPGVPLNDICRPPPMTAWTKADVRRACQAVENEERCVESVEIWPDGRLHILTRLRPERVESGDTLDWTALAGQTQVHGS
jgi:hypothetical protein